MTTLVNRATIALVVGALLTLTACQATTGSTPTPTAVVVVAPPVTADHPSPSACHAGSDSGQPLPDPHCTPGALNPAVTQATIRSTICVSGWTKTVRPPVSYTDQVKRQSIRDYGLPAGTHGELDHLVPLEAGGAPSDPRNLWIEVGPIPNLKDQVEGAARRAVCAGSLPLATVQAGFESDWVTLGRQLGVRIP